MFRISTELEAHVELIRQAMGRVGMEKAMGSIENGSRLKMYFLFKMGIFQPAMLVYQGAMAL